MLVVDDLPDASLTDALMNRIDTEWVSRGSCADLDITEQQAFFVGAGTALPEEYMMMCRACPVRVECLTYCVTAPVEKGFQGGMSPTVRRKLRVEEIPALVERERPNNTTT